MPKNAVQRLQDIDKNIKTVISIYEVASTPRNSYDEPDAAKKPVTKQFPENSTSKRLENLHFNKSKETFRQSQTTSFDPFKKTSGFVARPSQRNYSRESVLMKSLNKKKPGSAPSSSSSTVMLCESDPIWQQSTDPSDASERGGFLKTFDNMNNPECLDSNRFPEFGVVMTPSKTLKTANEILAEHNFIQNEESVVKKLTYETVSLPSPNGLENDTSFGKLTVNHKTDVKTNHLMRNSIIDVLKRKMEKENKVKSYLKSETSTREGSTKWDASASHKLNSYVETRNSKNKMLSDVSPTLSAEQFQFSTNTDDNLSVSNKSKVEEKFAGERKKNSLDNDQQPNFSQMAGSIWSSQKLEKAEENEEGLWENELSIIIEESNEKLEKMKVSKELAINIAKHLKLKCEEVHKSKEMILEKLKAVEKENEKLTEEVKELHESKKKLQKKIAGFLDSSGMMSDHEMKTKDLKEELYLLKSKICDSEKQHRKEIIEKQKQIEDLQKGRLEETRNGLKNQEILTSELQRLTNEKSEILAKFNDFRALLQDRKSKIQSLEETIHQLEEEVHKQKQHLKIKTETLQETNRELEMIRQNSTELEEQVRTLRKNIENFDGIQQDLIRQTAEYEEQLKASQEDVKKLRDENIRLKEQLENEKDGLRIKIKIIDDQQQTIKQLKEKSEEARSLLKRNQSLERILNVEREEKLELEEAVKRLKWRKEELKKKVKSLENDFLLAPQEVVKDLQKTQVVLHELENQVQMKQKEWELQLQSLIKEKEQACNVAEFATRKLMETTNEFQKQSEAYKGLQRILAENLAVKEKHLREGHKKAW